MTPMMRMNDFGHTHERHDSCIWIAQTIRKKGVNDGLQKKGMPKSKDSGILLLLKLNVYPSALPILLEYHIENLVGCR